MKTPFSEIAEKGRIANAAFGYASNPGDPFGVFRIRLPNSWESLNIVASNGDGMEEWYEGPKWEHVSVSLRDRCPTWEEMCWVKSLFWEPEETVIEFHPPESRYVNNHKHCLHLWRPVGVQIPAPPDIAVGVKV